MTSSTSTRPEPGDRIGPGTLVHSGGEAFPLRHFGREATHLVRVHGPDCDDCVAYLREIDGRGAALTQWYGRLVAVLPGGRDGAARLRERLGPRHLSVVADPEGEGPLASGGGAGAVIFDRYGEVFHACLAGPDHDFPSAEEVEEWLKYLATQCPECGVPDVA